MKAIRVHRFGGPEELKLEDVPDPQPAAGQVLVQISAAGVNPVETYIRTGKYGPRTFPYTPGSDAAGIVEAIGTEVTRVKPGDRVYTASTISGAYAQKALCSAQSVHPLPAHVTFAQGAALGVPYATAYYGLFLRARCAPAKRCSSTARRAASELQPCNSPALWAARSSAPREPMRDVISSRIKEPTLCSITAPTAISRS